MTPPNRPPTDNDDGADAAVDGRAGRRQSSAALARRGFLAAVPAVLGGCTAFAGTPTPTDRPDSDDDGVPDGADDYPNDPGRAVRSSRSEGSPTLPPGEVATGIALTNHPDASGEVLHYEVTVDGETPVDCLVFRRDAWDAYVDGARDVAVVDEYSRVGVTEASLTAQLDRGEFIFAVDYTGLLTDPGPDPVDVEYVVEMADPPEDA